MILNYWKTAFKVFTRNKVFTAITVLGLSIGISASLIIFLIADFEFSYDKIQAGGDRIYRIVSDHKSKGNEGHSAAIPAPLSSAVKNELAGMQAVVPLMQFQGDATAKVYVERGGNRAVFKSQTGIVFTNPDYFSLLPYQWIAGTVSDQPFHTVLSESRARQYFPSEELHNIIGRQIRYNDEFSTTVSGIVKDIRENVSFYATEFISFATIEQTRFQQDFMMDAWNDAMAYSQLYVKLSEGSNFQNIEKQMNLLFQKHNSNAYKDEQNYTRIHLQPLSDVHFNEQYTGFNQRIAHKPAIYRLFAVAAFLLLLACINFINLTTANSANRAKEIGIRKTLGGSKAQLVLQFLGETFMLTASACILSFALAPLLLRGFADFIPPGLQFNPLQQPYIFLFLFALSLLVSLLSGIYPSLILAGYKPVKVLNNQSFTLPGQTRHAWIRKVLTVSQFTIAQFFVIATVVVSKQINYSLNTDFGFKKESVVSFRVPRDDSSAQRRAPLLQEIKAMPGVKEVSWGGLAPAIEGAAFSNIRYEGAANDNLESVQLRWGDPNYIRLFDIKLVAGRNVQKSDTVREFLVNETYARLMGFQQPEDALGKMLDFNGKNLPVVGVIHDFNAQSSHSKIGPLVFAAFDNRSFNFHILLQPQNPGSASWSHTLAHIQKAFQKFYPGEDFSFTFFEETVAKFYEAEQRTASLLSWATGLTVLISCMGLLGLVIYTINTRTKEIGMRKVLGASVSGIVILLSKDFVQWVLLSFAIAAPLGFWATHKWLEDFAYRTTLNGWVFLLCGTGMLIVALLTLSIQTIKSALANPVKSLRTE